MSARPRFQGRLALAFGAVLLASTAAADVLVVRAIRARLISELSDRLLKEGRLVSLGLHSGRKAAELGVACGCRVTVVDAAGVVLDDSGVEKARLPELENHASRPEIAAALAGREGADIHRSATLGTDRLYVARPHGSGAVRLSVPLTEVQAQSAAARRAIFLASLTSLAAAFLLVWLLARSLARPVEELAVMAQRLSEGDYAARAPAAADDEHGRLAEALNTLAAKVQETVGALSRDRAQLSTILAHVVEAVAAVDAAGRVIAVNPALRALLGAPEAAGQDFLETLRHPRLKDLLGSVLKEGRARVEEIDLYTPSELHFEAHAVPLMESGAMTGALLVLHDITRLRRLEKMRREFVANVSHELRTPLASIKGLAETLRDGALEDPEHRMEFVVSIEKDAERLAALVEDLLDLSAIESGQRQPVKAPVDLLALARECAAALNRAAGAAKVTIEIAGGTVPAARVDRGQMKQVLTNLLDNAVKFNKPGGKVTVSFEPTHGGMEVSVADTGAGIPAEDLPRVFERFYRVDKARARDVGGTGLGLSIVKHIVEAHGGTVSAQSRPDQGSVFRFTLPA